MNKRIYTGRGRGFVRFDDSPVPLKTRTYWNWEQWLSVEATTSTEAGPADRVAEALGSFRVPPALRWRVGVYGRFSKADRAALLQWNRAAEGLVLPSGVALTRDECYALRNGVVLAIDASPRDRRTAGQRQVASMLVRLGWA